MLFFCNYLVEESNLWRPVVGQLSPLMIHSGRFHGQCPEMLYDSS